MHFPFCESKCNYCDFYSARFPAEKQQAYIAALCNQISDYGARLSLSADTLYLGGGTPTVLQAEALVQTIKTAKQQFGPFAEITVEANPADRLGDTFLSLRQAGVNRLSLGVQSADLTELQRLGRRHTPEQVVRCVADSRAAGIQNLSLDLMLGIPGQTAESLQHTLDFCLALAPEHISAYMLKIEEGTPFGRICPPGLPSEDETAALYLQMCDTLRTAGYLHYEISNFCKPGFESRHNLKYWTLSPYLGIGPGAHSFIDGKRFYFPRSLDSFLSNPCSIPDGDGGDENEYVMLRLRLAEGLNYKEYQRLYQKDFAALHEKQIAQLQQNGLVHPSTERLALTEKGFLLSNSIILQLLD
ncbi:MAG: radical SAM family heme chaperone HemW [Clostridia bacterium]|nr:radical SAM family heme chaperone HemW [Clostridia bacterium]